MADTNKDLQEAKKLLQELNVLKHKLGETPLNLTDAETLRQLKDLPKEIERARDALSSMEGTAADLFGQLKGIASEFSKQISSTALINGSMRKLVDIARDLKDNELLIQDLGEKKLKALQKEFLKRKEILDQEAKLIVNSSKTYDAKNAKERNAIADLKERIKALKESGSYSQSEVDSIVAAIRATKGLSLEQKAVLSVYVDQEGTINQINDQLKDQINFEKEINKYLGVGGALVNGMSGLMGKLGMNSSIFSDAIRDAEESMRDEARAAAEGLEGHSKMTVLMKGLGPLAKGFGRALIDPATIIEKILDGFLKVNEASVRLQRLTGQNSVVQAGFNGRMIDSVDYLTVAADLTEKIGFNAQNAFSKGTITQAAALKNWLGLSVEEASGLAVVAQTSGRNVNDIAEGVVKTTSAFNKANRSAVSQGVILKDIAKVSDNIKVSLGNNPKALAEAASAARRLGMDLGQVDKIADSLMDFETSIQNQLEAQLLTGKNIDLAKARELALNNDLAGLGKELFKNSADILEYGKMNRIQQEAYAKSLGMTKDDLAKIAYNRAIEAKMTDKQAAAAAGVTLEEMEQMKVQESLQKSLAKLAQAFAPMLEILNPIVSLITLILRGVSAITAFITGWPDLFWGTGPYLQYLNDILKFISGAALIALIVNTTKWKGLLGGILDSFKGIGGKISEVGGSMVSKLGGTAAEKVTAAAESTVGGTIADKLKEKAGEKGEELVGGAMDKTVEAAKEGEAIKPKAGQGIKDFLRNLASGLKAMGQPGVGKGAINLIPASAGLVVMIPGVLGAKAIEQINGPALKKALVNLATGLQAMSGTFLGSLALGAASIGLIAMIPGVLGAKAIEQLNGPALKKALVGLATGLQAMSGTLVGSTALVAASIGLIAMIPGVLGAKAIERINGPALKKGLTGLASGLKAFGKAVADPLFWLAIAGLGSLALVAMGFGKALSYVSPLIEALGKIIIGALKEVPSILGAVADGFVKIMGAVTLGNVGGLLLLGPALVSASVGMLAFSAALAAASVGNSITKLFTGEGILKPLKELAGIADPLFSVSSSLTSIASAITLLSTSLTNLSIEKLKAVAEMKFNSLQGVSTQNIEPVQTEPLKMAEGGIVTSQVSGVTVGETGKEAVVPLTEFYAKMDELISVVKKGGNVYLDGNKVGYNLMLGSTKLS